jgi:hypothetical protein
MLTIGTTVVRTHILTAISMERMTALKALAPALVWAQLLVVRLGCWPAWG